MLIELSRFKGLPVVSLDDEQTLGSIHEALVNPETGELVGCLIRLPGWLTPVRALSTQDIASYDPAGVVVRTPDCLVDPHEIIPLQQLTQSRNRWIGKVVETEAGERIGAVADLVINTDLEILSSIYTADLLKPERIIARDQIVSVTPKHIVVKELLPTQTLRSPSQQVPA